MKVSKVDSMQQIRPKVSVIVPVYKAREWIEECLESLCQQTLASNEFEILMIFNGPDDGSEEIVQRVSKRHPDVRVVLLNSEPSGASRARNVGIAEARGDFVTFVDADDWVSRNYLDLLLKNASASHVAVAQIVDVHMDGRHDHYNRFNRLILSRNEPIVNPKEFFNPLSFVASKMFPARWAKEIGFDESLRSSEDVIFNYECYSRFDFHFNLFPAAVGATYYRRYTDSSVSRGNASKEFLVNQRLQAMSALAKIRANAPRAKRPLLMQPLNAQMKFISRYMPRATEIEKQQIFDTIAGLGVRGLTWNLLQDEPRRLAVVLNFLPYNDTGAIVAAKRVREYGKTVDVISQSMKNLREAHNVNKLITDPYVRRHKQLTPSIRYFGSSKELEEFVRRGLAVAEDWMAEGRHYEELYSRSMWPHSHFLAAAIKRANPALHWEAEFSDPNSLSVEGKPRPHPPVTEELWSMYANWGTQHQQEELHKAPYVMRWAELLPYFFADTLTFTNRFQLLTMLEHAPEIFRDEIESKATIKIHPTLPEMFYQIREPTDAPGDDQISLAYFGDFYKTRGMSDIFGALDELSDAELAAFRLDIFTATKIEDVYTHLPERVQSIVALRPKLDYLSFLASLNAYDVLIVNDAHTTDYFPRNPYLPSKISDYLGSTTPIWAVVEPGSIMSTMIFAYESRLGDKAGAVNVLRQIHRTHHNVFELSR
jgi:glycosyltransferase involved in cell wall biosynthesis